MARPIANHTSLRGLRCQLLLYARAPTAASAAGIHKAGGADGQVSRVANRYALLTAAGELATAERITSWTQGEAAQRWFADWVRERGGIGSSEVADAKQRILQPAP